MMKRVVGKETAELLRVFVNKIAPFGETKASLQSLSSSLCPDCCKNWAAKSVRDPLDDSSRGKAKLQPEQREKKGRCALEKGIIRLVST